MEIFKGTFCHGKEIENLLKNLDFNRVHNFLNIHIELSWVESRILLHQDYMSCSIVYASGDLLLFCSFSSYPFQFERVLFCSLCCFANFPKAYVMWCEWGRGYSFLIIIITTHSIILFYIYVIWCSLDGRYVIYNKKSAPFRWWRCLMLLLLLLLCY